MLTCFESNCLFVPRRPPHHSNDSKSKPSFDWDHRVHAPPITTTAADVAAATGGPDWGPVRIDRPAAPVQGVASG
ncbi:hypothetical protein Scep_021837 [Stephania cephalantha]|uniref:Uncharacterized protein n=1 Tax=Stephania cephalantha TaxID=152367 RepID=A0AAP0FCH7_9MAGN